MKGYIYFALIKSVENMFANQPDLAEFSDMTDDHEPNISFHLANELWKYFPWLSCDFDVIKLPPYGRQRPDIIFHRRGNHDKNILVLEIKRESNNNVEAWRCSDDEDKIIENWFTGDLSYDFGASVVIDELTQEFNFMLIQRNPLESFPFSSKIAEIVEGKEDEIEEIINEILAIKKEDKKANISEIANQIDEIIDFTNNLTDEERHIFEVK